MSGRRPLRAAQMLALGDFFGIDPSLLRTQSPTNKPGE